MGGSVVGRMVGGSVGDWLGGLEGVEVGDAVGSSVGVGVVGVSVVGGRVVGSTVGVRVGRAVGAAVGFRVGRGVGAVLGRLVGAAVGGGVAAALHTALVIVPIDRERALKPDVMATAWSLVGVETQGCTVLHGMPVPMSSTMTLIPAFLAAENSTVGLSPGLPSVIMISTLGTPLRPLLRAFTALRTAGTMYVPPR